MPHPADSGRSLDTDTRLPDDARVEVEERLVPGLTVLYHPDPERIGDRVALPALAATGEQALSRLEPELSPPHKPGRRPLADAHVSRTPLRLAGTGDGGVKLVATTSPTPVRADGESISGVRTFSVEEVRRGVVLTLAGRVVLLLHLLDPLGAEPDFGPRKDLGMIGDSAAMDRLRRELTAVAELDVPVLLRGETGTGKELAARALHRTGGRRGGPFLTLNMAAIPPNLAASELFGAARGAFTGADRKREGYFLRADGGTLFLDEIGETPAEIQSLLLRALESGEIQPVGADGTRRVDVRLIAATDAPLEQAVAEGTFRAPLLHRLAAYPIHLPPLRLRRDDFGRLLRFLLDQESRELGLSQVEESPSAWLPAPLVARLAAFAWPGNVRQLRNAVRRLLVTRKSLHGTPQEAELPARLAEVVDAVRADPVAGGQGSEPRSVVTSGRTDAPYRKPSTVSERELVEALEAEDWNLQAAAERLRVSRTSLYALVEKSRKVRVASDLNAEEVRDALAATDGDVPTAAERLRVSEAGLRRHLSRLEIDLSSTSPGDREAR